MPATPDWAVASVSSLPALVDLPTAARETSLSASSLRRYAAQGRLRILRTAPASGGGGRSMIARAELARFIAALAGEGA